MRMRLWPILGCLASGGLLLVPSSAWACGGFFCGGQVMNQSGEEIIFAEQNGQLEAHVLIQYTGAADQFAWVVPVHAQPTLSIGSPTFFQQVNQATQPYFQLDWQQNGNCYGYGRTAFTDNAGGSTPQTGPAGAPVPGVDVLQQSQVGPYESATLTATDASALSQWLQTNGYNLTPQGSAALSPYVGQGYYFVALKLQQNQGTGDIRPIVLSFPSTTPCIPIQLTAIAAQPNMPIHAFVFADTRAVPTNYREVEINETKIDWLNYGTNYASLATAAVLEAGGHAFMTEFAAATSTATGLQNLPGGNFNTAKLATITDPVDFLLEMLAEGFPRDPSIQDMLLKYVPEPAALVAQGVTTAQFYNGIANFRDAIANDPGRAPFDPVSFANDLQTIIVAPLLHAQQIVATYPYLTRLYTTLSPELMTLDPEFNYNSGLGDVSNQNTAKATPICNALNSQQASVIKIELPDGTTFYLTPGGGPLDTGPNASVVEQLGPSGPPVIITDNRSAIAKAVAAKGCSCGTGMEPLALLGLLAALKSLRRRRP
jgi:MYXO-CTERM domain-containing protein